MKYLLLGVPCLLSVCVPLFNSTAPDLFGIPFFYWFQLLLIPVSAITILAADRIGKA
jgi:choline-glycine betaine transporter